MKIKLFNEWYKRILSLLLAFTFVFGGISPILTYGAATDSSSDVEATPQWNGSYRINTYNGYVYNYSNNSIDIYGTCLLTEDGHFFRANAISDTYSDTLYNLRGYQIYDQTLENGRWYEPFISKTFKNAYFGKSNILLVGHDGKLYQAYYRDIGKDYDTYLNEIGITESDIDDVNLIEDLIKTKDNNYYTFSGKQSNISSGNVNYFTANISNYYANARYDAGNKIIIFSCGVASAQRASTTVNIPDDVILMKTRTEGSAPYSNIYFDIYTKSGKKYIYNVTGSITNYSSTSNIKATLISETETGYVGTVAGKFINTDGYLVETDGTVYGHDNYSYDTDILKIDKDGNIYGGYGSSDGDDFTSYSGNLSHMCTYSSANVSFTEEELNDNITKTFVCSCGKTYEISAVDYNNIDPDGYSEPTEPTCTEPGGIYLNAPITGEALTDGIITSNALGHSCTKRVDVTPATCTQKGTYGYQCTRCDYIMTSQSYTTDMIPHTFGGVYSRTTGSCTDEFYGYKICSVCNQEIAVDHITNGQHIESEDYTVETEPTCLKDGLKYKTCSVCGEKLEDTIINTPRLEHQFEITDNTATCTKSGKGNYTCTLCGIDYKTLRTEPLGHDYVSHIKTAATCGNTGIEEFICSRCGDTFEEEIEGTIHDYISKTEKEPTCTETGVMKYTCKGCGDSYTEKILPLEHDYIADVKKEATADTQGLIMYTCSKCGDQFEVITAKDNGIRVYAGSKRILVNDTNNGHMYFTGPNDNNVEGQTVSLENTIDDEYGTRQMRMTVAAQESINYGNAVYYYGTPTSSYWGMNTLDEIITIDDDCAKEWVYYSGCDYLKGAYGKNSAVKSTGHDFPNGIRTYVGNGTVDVSSGTNYLLFVDRDGKFYTVNRYFHLCDHVGGKNENMMRSANLWTYENIKFKEISSMEKTAAGLLTDGRIAVINTNFVEDDINLYDYKKANGLGEGLDADEWHQPKISITEGNIRFTAESAGTFGIYGIDTNGHLRHINNDGSYSEPLNDTIYTKVSSGKDHCLVLDINGNIWAFGKNEWSQCGNGQTADISVPEQITSGIYFTDISAGYQISAAIDAAKNYYAWGHNNYSQCGVLKDGVNTITTPTVMFNVSHVHYYNKDSYKLISTPTCEQDGVVKRTCLECGNTEEIYTPARAHDYIEPFRIYDHYVNYKKDVTDEPLYHFEPNASTVIDLYVKEPDVYTVAVEHAESGSVYIVAFSKSQSNVFRFVANGSESTSAYTNMTSVSNSSAETGFFDGVYYSRFSYAMAGDYNCDMTTPLVDGKSPEVTAADAIWESAKAEMNANQDCSAEHHVRKICKYCYDSIYEDVPAGQHTISKMGDKTSKPGYTQWRCSVCGELIKEELNAYSVRMTLKDESSTYSKMEYFAKPEQFSTSLATDEEFTLPDEGTNSGEFIIDFGPFKTADGKNKIVGKSVVDHYVFHGTTYYPGDVIKNLSTTENDTITIQVVYRMEFEFPDVLYYKDSQYAVKQYELGLIPYSGIHFMPDYWNRRATYTVGESVLKDGFGNKINVIASGTHIYAYPSVKTAMASGNATYQSCVDYVKDIPEDYVYLWEPAASTRYSMSVTQPNVYTVAVKYPSVIYIVAFNLSDEGVLTYNYNTGDNYATSAKVSDVITESVSDYDNKNIFFDGVYYSMSNCSSSGTTNCDLTVTESSNPTDPVAPVITALNAVYDRYASASAKDAYAEDLNKDAKNDYGDKTYTIASSSIDHLFNSKEEAEEVFDDAEIEWTEKTRNAYYNVTVKMTTDGSNSTSTCGYLNGLSTYYVGFQKTYGRKIYVIPGIKDVVPNYRNYGIYDGYEGSNTLTLSAYSYVNSITLHNTLDGTETTCSDINNLPKYIYNDDKTKILIGWSLEEGSDVLYIPNVTKPIKNIDLYSVWTTVSEELGDYKFNEPVYKPVNEFNKDDQFYANDILLIGSNDTNGFQKAFFGTENTTAEIKLKTNNDTLKSVFNEYMKGAETINGLEEINSAVIFNTNGTESKVYMTSASGKEDKTKVGNHKVILSGQNVYFDQNGKIAFGELVNDNNSLRVLSNNSLYTVDKVFMGYTTIDALKTDMSRSYTGYLFLNDSDELEEIFFDAESNAYTDVSGNILSDGTRCYKEDEIYFVDYDIDNKGYKLNTRAWDDTINIDLVLTGVDGNKFLTACGAVMDDGSGYYSNVLYDAATYQNAYDKFLERYLLGIVDKSYFVEAYLVNSLASDKDVTNILQAKSYELVMFPRENELKKYNMFVEEYRVDSVSSTLWGKYTINMIPSNYNLDVYSETAYEYMPTDISAEALGTPEVSEWHVKYDKNAADIPTVLNFFTNDNTCSSSDYTRRTSNNMYDLVKPRIYEDVEQVVKFTADSYSIVDSNALHNFKIYKRDYDGNLTDITEKAGVTIKEKASEYKPLNGEHIKKIVNTYGTYTDSNSFIVLTEEGHLWLSGSYNGGSYTPLESELNINNYQNNSYSLYRDPLKEGLSSFVQIGGNTKFKDFYFNYLTLVAIDEEGNLWVNWSIKGNTYSFGLHKVSDGIEFTKIGAIDYYNPICIPLLDKDGNVWVFASKNGYSDSGTDSIFNGNIHYNSGLSQWSPVTDYYGASSTSVMEQSVLMQLTEGTRFIDVGSETANSEGIVAIDEDGKMWIGGYISNLPGTYINGVPSYSNIDWKYSYIPYMKQLTDIYPGVYDDIQWISIEDRRYNTTDTSSHLGFIDADHNLWECFDSSFGYEVTETNVLDGAGKYVLDTEGKIHVRDEHEKAECLRTDNIILEDYTFKEIGSACSQYFLTEDGTYVFTGSTGGESVGLLDSYGFENWFYIDFYSPAITYVSNNTYGTTSVNDKYGNDTGIKGLFSFNDPGVDIDTFSFETGQPAGYSTSYDVSIDIEALENIGKVKIMNGDSFVIMANPSDDTLYRITDAESVTYDIVDSYITNENVTSDEMKSNTPITMNTLTIAPVTMSMDNSIYYLKSNYASDEIDYYSDMISLNVVALESLKAEYVGDDVTVGTHADTDDVKLTLTYEDGHEIEISWSDLTKAPDNLLVENIGPNTYEVEFEGKKATFDINGKVGIINLTANYPESVFVGTEFEPEKVTVTAIYSDGSTTTPDIDWKNVDKVIKQIGNNRYVINYEDVSTNLIIQGYYYNKLTAEYHGNPINIYESYNKEDVDVTITYTENNLGKTEDILTSDEWKEDSLIVSAVGENIFTAVLVSDPKFSDTYSVEGLDYFTSLRATYMGEDILTGNDYDKDDVLVEGINKSDGNGVIIPSDEWTESGLTVTANGKNLFTASYNGLNADYYVNGYSEGLQATYVGDDILVGKTYNKNDVEVYVTDTKGSRIRINTENWTEDNLVVTLDGNNEFTATYNGMQDTFTVNGYQIAGLTAIYTGNAIPVGEKYEKIDVVVIAKYSNGTERQLAPDEWNESDLVVTNVGDNDFTASYNGYKADYVVPGMGIVAIRANYNGKDIFVGNSYNKKDVEVVAIYSDGSETILDKNEWTESDLKVKAIGNNDYIASYDGLEADYVVPGYDIKGITAEYHGKDILVGEKYDKKDVVVTVEYTNGTKRTLEPDDWKESSLVVEKDGDNTYKAHYNEFTAEYTVLGYKVIGISAVYKGEPIKVGNDYEKADVLVKLLFSNNTEKDLNIEDWTESSLEVTRDGKNNYTATYDTFTADYQVLGYTVTEPKVVKVEGRYPEDVLVGNKYEEMKAIITITYDNGETSELDYNKLDAKPDDTTVKQIGENQYPIAYKGIIGTMIVIGYDIDKITAEYKGPDVIVGKEYSKDDVIVTVHYTNGKTAQITDFSVDSLTVTKVGENNYIATYKGKTAQYVVMGIIEPTDVIAAKAEKPLDNFIINVKTGDSSPVVLCIILIIIGITALVLLFVYKHKHHRR